MERDDFPARRQPIFADHAGNAGGRVKLGPSGVTIHHRAGLTAAEPKGFACRDPAPGHPPCLGRLKS